MVVNALSSSSIFLLQLITSACWRVVSTDRVCLKVDIGKDDHSRKVSGNKDDRNDANLTHSELFAQKETSKILETRQSDVHQRKKRSAMLINKIIKSLENKEADERMQEQREYLRRRQQRPSWMLSSYRPPLPPPLSSLRGTSEADDDIAEQIFDTENSLSQNKEEQRSQSKASHPTHYVTNKSRYGKSPGYYTRCYFNPVTCF